MEDKLGKVLIVDDDAHINELIDMYLKSGGYSTKKCFNGNDACNIVSTEDIGLVILDVMLPGRDGIEVLKYIRKSSDIPVIMLTAKGEVFDKSEEPVEFPLGQVIEGWKEGFQLLPVGTKATLYIPANLAYGSFSPSEKIGANSVLVFEVELLDIVKDAPKAEAKADAKAENKTAK